MKSVSYNSALDAVTLDPGVRWVEVQEQLEQHGVAALGGRMGYVGLSQFRINWRTATNCIGDAF